MSNYPEKCHVAGCPCHEWSAKSPSESPETLSKDAGFLVPEAKNVSTGLETPRIDPYEYLRTFKYAPPAAESVQPAEITVPTFTEEWDSAPRAMIRYVEQDRLRAVLFDVIDGGCTCDSGEQHPWELDHNVDNPEIDEDINQRSASAIC